MPAKCEACGAASDAAAEKSSGRFARVLVESRVLILCARHARVVRAAAPGTVAEAQALLHELSGRRSLIGRRAPLDRRVFPARPEGRRRSAGRRATDID